VQLLVSDDGCGLFERVRRDFEIDDPTLAMVELGKGKLTSDPARHRGHGLYFTARVADILDLHANHAAFQYRGAERRRWHAGRALRHEGTSVFVAIALDTTRTVDDALRAASTDGGYAFETTQVPLSLLAGGGLASRAEAKRVAARLPDFRRAEVDFSGIDDVGHGFADELFRVFAAGNPAVELVPIGMAPRVAALVETIRAGA
jgi:hypothetical protein